MSLVPDRPHESLLESLILFYGGFTKLGSLLLCEGVFPAGHDQNGFRLHKGAHVALFPPVPCIHHCAYHITLVF